MDKLEPIVFPHWTIYLDPIFTFNKKIQFVVTAAIDTIFVLPFNELSILI